MFFKRFACLNVIVSFLLSSQTYAAEVSGSYVYLPKTVSSNSSVVDSKSSYSDRPLYSYDFEHFISPIDKELDRMEVMHNILQKKVASVAESAPVQTTQATTVVTQSSTSVEGKKPIDREVDVPLIKEPSSKPLATNHSVVVSKSENVSSNSAPVPKNIRIDEPSTSSGNDIKTIFMDDIVSANPAKPSIRLVYKTSVILQSRNIQRYIPMDEGFVDVQKIDRNQIKITALRYGGTFLNVWDDGGRRTIYVGIVFPQVSNNLITSQAQDRIEQHEKPFRFKYSNDYDTYYFMPKGSKFKRQSYQFIEDFSLEGHTPYGYFDTSMNMNDFDGVTTIPSYSVGLSNIPLEGVDQFNMRGFDSVRDQSPLTMSNTHLRGFFTSLDTFNDLLGISYDYGQKKPFASFIPGLSQNIHSNYINAFKFTLFPKDKDNQISVNVDEGFGSQHEDVLAKKVDSIEVRKRFYNLYLNGEYAQTDQNRNASLAGLKWQQGSFTSALNFRQTNKQFTTIASTPAYQGEIGGTWSTSYFGSNNFTEDTSLDIYRQYLFYNPNNPDALNLDASMRFGVPLFNGFHSDSSIYYVDTSGEATPRRNISLDERISRGINFLGFKNTNVYVGGVFQRVRYEATKAFAYDRSSFLSGIQIPLTAQLSLYANYDFSWVHEFDVVRNITPNVFNTGFYYNKQFTNKLSGNFDMSYHKEVDVKGSTGYLAGEDSAGISLGLSYNPSNDVSFFLDGRSRKVWPLFENNVSYNDLDIRLGMRMAFDVLSRGWDPNGVVSGHVYKDNNGDGHYDVKDQGIKGAKVNVGHSQAVTDENGYYQMNVNAKSVLVAPVAETLPPGVVFSTPTSQNLDIKPWGTTKVDFGLNSQTGVYGLVFVDQNGNGTPDEADRFINKVKVVLDNKFTCVTDTQGAYYFRNVAAGKHTIRIDINSLPINMIPLIKLENQIKISEGTTFMFHIPLKVQQEKQEDKPKEKSKKK